MATVDTELGLELTARDSRFMGVGIKKNVRSVKYMQDRYLFKGKRTDNEEWIGGWLFELVEISPPFIMMRPSLG